MQVIGDGVVPASLQLQESEAPWTATGGTAVEKATINKNQLYNNNPKLGLFGYKINIGFSVVQTLGYEYRTYNSFI